MKVEALTCGDPGCAGGGDRDVEHGCIGEVLNPFDRSACAIGVDQLKRVRAHRVAWFALTRFN